MSSIGYRKDCPACGGLGTVANPNDPTTPMDCVPCRGRGYTWTSPEPDTKPDGARKARRG